MIRICSILHVSCRMCKFLALLSCKSRIVYISCTSCLTRWKSCTFFAPVILQGEILQLAPVGWKSCKFYTNLCAEIFASYCITHVISEFFNFASFKFLQHLCFCLTQGFTNTLVLVNIDFVSGKAYVVYMYVWKNTDKHLSMSSSWSSVELLVSIYLYMLLIALWGYAHL